MIKNLLVILYIFPLFTISALNNDSTNFQSSDTFGVTPHSVIENYIEAIGGRERIAEIIDQTIVLKSTTPNIDLAIKIIRKAPNKLFVELDYSVGKQITIFNGEKGKVESIGQFKNVLGMELEQLKYQAQLNPFLRYFTDEFSLEFKGVEKVNDEDSYKIVITSTNNKKITQFYSVNSRLKLREVNELTTPQGSFIQIIDTNDYKNVNRIKFPFRITQKIGEQIFELDVVLIELNKDIPDSLFEID